MVTTISVKEIAKKLNVPVDIIVWNIKNSKTLTVLKDYTLIKGEYSLSVTGFIWLLGLKLTTDYDLLLDILSIYFKKEENDLFHDIQKILNDYAKKTWDESKDIQEEIKDVEEKVLNNDKYGEKSDVPKTTDPYAIEWSVKTRTKIKSLVNNTKNSDKAYFFMPLLKKVYRKMEKYGFDFNKNKIEILKKNNLPEDAKVSNWRIVEEAKEYMDLFDKCLNEICLNEIVPANHYIGNL